LTRKNVFIHRSIKTRIETFRLYRYKIFISVFLYIDPLKQGLKLDLYMKGKIAIIGFLYIDPLKQGLKRIYRSNFCFSCFGFYT